MPFNRNMLNLARELRAVTQADLSSKSSVSQTKISKFEAGLLVPTDEDVCKLADALELPIEFFSHRGPRPARASTCLHHRKNAGAKVRDLDRVHAHFAYMRMQIDELLAGVKIGASQSVYQIDVDAMDGDVEQIAAIVRQTWGVPPGPIDNLTLLIEHAGAIVVAAPFYSDAISAMSFWPDSGSPIIFVNASMPGDRLRFSLAHELGHLVMHATPTGEVEAEANRFAAELLMPKATIFPELSSGVLSLQKLAALKVRWKVAIQALARRAHDLEIVSERQYRSLLVRISKMGWRTNEPIRVEPEQSTVLPSILTHYLDRKGYTRAELSKLMLSVEPQLDRNFLVGKDQSNRLRLAE